MGQWQFEIFVDRGCALCSRESQWLERLDSGRGRLRLTDIGSPAFLSGDHGLSVDDAMRSIHGRWRDGRIIHGLDVFRAAYGVLGYGWLWAPTRLPLLRPASDAAYRVFARWRYGRVMRRSCPIAVERPPANRAATASAWDSASE